MRGRRAAQPEAAQGVTAERSEEPRPLGAASMLALGINGIVGVGIFFAPSVVAAEVPGRAGLLVYLATLAACLPVALVFARLSARFDEDGGPYVYARAAFGPTSAFAIGWIAYVGAVFSTSAVIVGFVEAAAPLLAAAGVGPLGPLGRAFTGAIFTTVLAATLASGLRLSARIWSAVTVSKLVPLLALLAAAAIAGGPAEPAASAGHSIGDPFAAALALLFALQGFEIVAVPAAHVRAFSRVVPFATVASLLGAGALYIGLHAACLRALPDLGAHRAPLVDAAAVFGGPALGRLVRAGMFLSTLGIAIGMLAMTPRYLSALGRTERFASALAVMSARGVPLYSFVVTWALVVAVVASSSLISSLAELFSLSSIAVLVQYVITSAALGRLALRRRHGLRPVDAWPVPLAFAGAALLVRGAGIGELSWVAGAALVGFAVRLIGSARLEDRARRAQP